MKYALSVFRQYEFVAGHSSGLTSVYVDARIALMIAVCKTLEHSVDLLCFFGQLDLHEQFTDCHIDRVAEEGELAHITSKHG